MNWKVLGISAGLTIVGSLVILGVIGICSHDPGVAVIWSDAIPITTGIIIGACVFFVLDTLVKHRYKWMRGVSSILSGLIASLTGGFEGAQILGPIYHSMVFLPHPEFALGHEDILFYQGMIIVCALVAGIVGMIFGAGIGQHTRQQ